MAGLKARIVEKSSYLNPSDKKILNYLLNNAAECSELSLAKLAKKLYVSESAIFRLCKKVGLSGYSELKYELADFSKGEKRMVKQQDTFAERLVKIGEGGKLFGSVTGKDVADALKKVNIEIDKRKIGIKGEVTGEGVYEAVIKVHPTITSTVKVNVVAG